MFKTDKRRADRRDPIDTLSAIWILASNDENPEISYAGLRVKDCVWMERRPKWISSSRNTGNSSA